MSTKMKFVRKCTLIGMLSLTPLMANAEVLMNAETSGSGSPTHASMVAFAEVSKDAGLATIQIQDGQTLTKSMLNVAAGKTDIATLPQAAYMLLGNGNGPFKKLGAEKGKALANNIRALFGFTPGMFTPICFNDTGIKSWKDFKGKTIFVGPPSGAAAVNIKSLIEAVTGYKAGEDYKEVLLGWDAATQAMLDRKFDVYFAAAADPSPVVEQIASAGDISIFGVPEEVFTTDSWKEFVNRTGTSEALHSSKNYETGVTFKNKDKNGNLHMMAYTFFMGVNASKPKDQVKALVANFMNSLDTVESKAAFMPGLGFRQAIVGLAETPGLKLHPGAVEALEEAGISIPEKLR